MSRLVTVRSALLCSSLVLGCVERPPAAPPPGASTEVESCGALAPPSAYQGEYMRRQSLEATFEKEIFRFSAILQKQGDTLLVVGLSPFGTREFALLQDGATFTVDGSGARHLPFNPRLILEDIHHAYFETIGGEPPSEGTRAGRIGTCNLVEEWNAGGLVEKRFSSASGAPLRTIRYERPAPQGHALSRIFLRDHRYGYTLTIDTVSDDAL